MRDTYQLGMGKLVVDLRQTELPAGDVPVAIDLGIGEARLIVPDDVCVATDAEVGIGALRIGDAGTDLDLDRGRIDFGSRFDDDLGRNVACDT